jgi:aspartyl protease family protein
MSSGSNLVWAGIGLIAFAFLAPTCGRAPPLAARPDKPRTQAAAPASASAPVSINLARRELVRAADGHFYADAMVNGAQVRFLIDTGASMVALTPADAQRAGIFLPAERVTARGAGGTIEVTPIVIERIAIGPLEARGVAGAVARELPVSLLGQSFLERVGRVEIEGDRMVLR